MRPSVLLLLLAPLLLALAGSAQGSESQPRNKYLIGKQVQLQVQVPGAGVKR